jgi:ATP/maltotriose-dependent transcriptional regulator MalT
VTGPIRLLVSDDHPVVLISEATVKTHLLHMFEKLGVSDRTAAVTIAIERGLLRRRG